MVIGQTTVKRRSFFKGVGLHSGADIEVTIEAGAPNSGIIFQRVDRPHSQPILADIENVVDSTLATTLGAGVNGSRVTVGTVEHLLSALAGLGIDNALIKVDGPEIPIMDGSAHLFVEGLLDAGLIEHDYPKKFAFICKPIEVREQDKWVRIEPYDGFRMTCTIDFNHPLISNRPFGFDGSRLGYCRDLSAARTFGFRSEVDKLRSAGLALGGSLDNAIVIDDSEVMNRGGLRFPDEFVRHKILDAIGDLSLFGASIVGHVKLHRPGHALNAEILKAMKANIDAFAWGTMKRCDFDRMVEQTERHTAYVASAR